MRSSVCSLPRTSINNYIILIGPFPVAEDHCWSGRQFRTIEVRQRCFRRRWGATGIPHHECFARRGWAAVRSRLRAGAASLHLIQSVVPTAGCACSCQASRCPPTCAVKLGAKCWRRASPCRKRCCRKTQRATRR
jgi:hypothetical protein